MLIESPSKFHLVSGSSCCESTNGRGFNERRRRSFWTIISTTNYFRRRGAATHAPDTTRRRRVRPSNKLLKLYICAVNRRRMHLTRGCPEPIYTWQWRSRSYYRAPARKKNKGSGGSGAASEIYGGAAPSGAGVSPSRSASRLPGSAMRARVGLHGEYWLPTGRTINRRSVDVARWEFTRSLSALDLRELSTFAFPASISLIASSHTGYDATVLTAVY